NKSVRTFNLVGHGFADVVEQTRALCGGNIHTEFASQKTHDLGNFDRVLQEILAVASAEMKTTKQLYNFRMHRRGAEFHDRFVTTTLHHFVHLLRDFGDDFFDACGMNAAVENQALHRFASNFAAHRIEAGKDNGAGSIIDQHRHASGGFECANVAAFATDD